MAKLYKVFFSLLGLLLLTNSAFGSGVVTIYYVPLNIETYIPITRSKIVCKAWEKLELSDANALRLSAIVAQGEKAKFDAKRVRVQISDETDTFYIDSNGVVLKGDQSFRIDKKEFISFVESINPEQRMSIKNLSCRKP